MNLTREEAMANPVIRAAMGAQVAAKPKRNKYGATRTLTDGIWFDSKKEAQRYLDLKHLQQTGHVRWFARQPRFVLPGGIEYVADFVVAWADSWNRPGHVTVEDVKGVRTKTYRLKKRQVEVLYHVKIQEV